MLEQQFHENIDIQNVNTLPRRAFYIPYQLKESAYRLETRYQTNNVTLLNGNWYFKYFNSIEDYLSSLEIDKSQIIPVPSVWNIHGYDQIQYLNTQYPIPFDPPYVPKSNPCGRYIRSFEVTEYDEKSDYHLNFEGVDSAFYLWINNQFVGYSQISHSISEFDITSYVHSGTNTIQVLVLKYSDGTYFEDQDMFRHSGIFRDVYILKRAKSRINDFRIETRVNELQNQGIVDVKLEDKQGLDSVQAQLYGPDGALLQEAEISNRHRFIIETPQLWSTEKPTLYTITLTTKSEVITQKVGIREIRIQDNQFYINGQSIKFRGTNYHDSDPQTGYVMSEAQFMKDLTLMKQGNFNAIRTAHYPKSPLFYELADQYGFYVMSEADLETHGVVRLYGEENTDYFNLITDNPQYEKPIVERIEASIIPFKNYSSIVSWSMGNESGFGVNIVTAMSRVKTLDDTRPIHYEGTFHRDKSKSYDLSNVEMISRMYASPEEVEQKYLTDPDLDKPFILCEYAHAMGNSPGDLHAYQMLVEQYDSFIGGFVWEWCDHGIQVGQQNGKPIFRYGGDFGEELHDGNFCVDGIVFPDRTPHEGYYEFKHEHRPVRVVEEANGILKLRNQLDFSHVENYLTIEATATFLNGDKTSFDITVDNFEPHSTQDIDLSNHIKIAELSDILLRYKLKNEEPLRHINFELGQDQIVYQRQSTNQHELDVQEGPVSYKENSHSLIVLANGYAYTFNKENGSLISVVYEGHTIVNHPTKNKIWRAPIDNDINVRKDWEYMGYAEAYTRVQNYKVEENNTAVSINFEIVIVHDVVPPILQGEMTWTVQSDGSINITYDLEKDIAGPFLPRFGLEITLPHTFEAVKYYGNGPFSSYSDKGVATYLDYFDTTVTQNGGNHIKPQESGSHNGTTYAKVSNDEHQITVTSDQPFSFNTTHYSLEQLTHTMHEDQLVEEETYMYIDYGQSGIGSNSCGPELSEIYQLNDKHIQFQFKLNFE